MKKIFSKLPVYLLENFHVVSDENKSNYIKVALNNRFKTNLPAQTYSYMIFEDQTKFYKHLYYKFYSTCKTYFSFTPLPSNIDSVWAYVSNSNDYASVFHDHKNTCTINSVYYLNVPDANSGDIEFMLDGGKIYKYHPNNFDLIIFPDYLMHKPNQSMSDEWRVAINMEIKAEESSEELFSRLET